MLNWLHERLHYEEIRLDFKEVVVNKEAEGNEEFGRNWASCYRRSDVQLKMVTGGNVRK